MDTKLYDLSFVKEMSGNNEEFIKQLIELFIESVPESAQNINNYYKTGNYEKLVCEIHKLKSTIKTVRIPAFTDQIEEMEKLAKSGKNPKRLKHLVFEFNEIMPKAVEQLKEELNNIDEESNPAESI